jgi:Cu(I)/Ag(I) efflux system outer membrane protein
MSESDRQNYFASEEARRAVHILLVSNVSQSYFSQQLAYEQLRIAQETLKNYQQSLAFVEQQLVTGSTNVLALEQARGQIESTRAEIAKEKAIWHRQIMRCSLFWEPTVRCRQKKG